MKFTEEHIEVIERHKGHWETLRTAGFMRNVDRPVFDELQNVHNEVLGPVQYTHWCPSCVADLVRILYTNYEKWQSTQCGLTVGEVTGGAALTADQKKEIEQKFNTAFTGGRKRKHR
jgi:hypothetical protein